MNGYYVHKFQVKMYIEYERLVETEDLSFTEDMMRPDDYEALPTLVLKMFCHTAEINDLGELEYTFGKEHDATYIEITSTDCDIDHFFVLITPRAFTYFDNYICYLTSTKINEQQVIE